MKTAVQKSPISTEHTFDIHHLVASHFDPNWHFHSEFQLFIVLKGTGTRFVGDHVAPFKPGDLVFTGPNLPHLWQSDAEYFHGDNELITEGIVIYFHENFLGDFFLQKKEMFRIRQLLDKAQRGIAISGPSADEVKKLMISLIGSTDFDSVLILMNILNIIACSSTNKVLSSPDYSNSMRESETGRMNRVHGYVMKNFRERITLTQVADVASMTPQSFSRYFKTHANKTFSDFLTEIRISYACKLLVEKKMSISQICYDSGFNTLSNFNRQFKATTHYSPLEYKKKYALSSYS